MSNSKPESIEETLKQRERLFWKAYQIADSPEELRALMPGGRDE